MVLHLGHIRYEYLNESKNKEKKKTTTEDIVVHEPHARTFIRMIDSIQTRQKKQSTKCMVDNEANEMTEKREFNLMNKFRQQKFKSQITQNHCDKMQR